MREDFGDEDTSNHGHLIGCEAPTVANLRCDAMAIADIKIQRCYMRCNAWSKALQHNVQRGDLVQKPKAFFRSCLWHRAFRVQGIVMPVDSSLDKFSRVKLFVQANQDEPKQGSADNCDECRHTIHGECDC
jgi:hypothetical protein